MDNLWGKRGTGVGHILYTKTPQRQCDQVPQSSSTAVLTGECNYYHGIASVSWVGCGVGSHDTNPLKCW